MISLRQNPNKGGSMDDYTLNLFKLKHINIDLEKSEIIYNDDDSSTLKIFLNKSTDSCPHCGSKDIKVRSTIINNINYTIYIDLKSVIELHRRKFLCNYCGKYFIEKNPIISENSNISYMTDLRILELLKDPTITYSKAAKLTNTSPTHVQNVFDNKIRIPRGNLATVICIDEVYAKRLADHKYICSFYNPFEKKIIEILDTRYKYDLIEFTAKYSVSERCKVKYVSIDLWDSYKEVALISFPNAIVCADSFHVIKNLNVCFDTVRKKVQKRFEHLKKDRNSYYWLYKKYWKFLLRDFSKIYNGSILVRNRPIEMYMNKYQILDHMLELDEELKRAYELKEAYRNFNQTASILDARDRLEDIITLFKQSRIKEYNPFIKLMKKWKNEIVNSFTKYNNQRIHNGYIERNNLLIKQIFNNGFGFKNFKRTRNRIIYIVNNNIPISGSTTKITNKNKGFERGKYKK